MIDTKKGSKKVWKGHPKESSSFTEILDATDKQRPHVKKEQQ